MQESNKKSNSKPQKVSKVPDSWREHLQDCATATGQAVLSLARKGGGEFWTAEVVLVRSDVEAGVRAFIVTTTNPADEDEPGLVSNRLTPQACAKKLWAIASFHASEYAAEHDLSQLRTELKLNGCDGELLNVSDNTRAVINCAQSEDSVPWLSDDDAPANEGIQARLNASQQRELRLMAKMERNLDRRESQVGTVISATEQLGAAATKLVEARLEAADTLSNEIMKNAYGSRIDEYGEMVMTVVLPKLDNLLDAIILKHTGQAPDAAPASSPSDAKNSGGAIDVEVVESTTDQPPGEFFVWVLNGGGPEALASFTKDMSTAPSEGAEVRVFWGAVLEALGDAIEANPEKLVPVPDAVKRWARHLVSRYTLTSPEWSAAE